MDFYTYDDTLLNKKRKMVEEQLPNKRVSTEEKKRENLVTSELRSEDGYYGLLQRQARHLSEIEEMLKAQLAQKQAQLVFVSELEKESRIMSEFVSTCELLQVVPTTEAMRRFVVAKRK